MTDRERRRVDALKAALHTGEISGAMAMGELECLGYSHTVARQVVQRWKLEHDTTPSANRFHAGGIPEMGVTV